MKRKRRRGLNRGIGDAAWATFFNWLKYKGCEGGREVVAVPPEHTSRICPACGERVWKGDLGQRKRVCPICNWEGDRDVAAARVILQRALKGRGPASVEGAIKGPRKQEPARVGGRDV